MRGKTKGRALPVAVSRLLVFSLLANLLLPAAPARAAFTDLGAGARAPGMGNAFTGLADDVYAIYYNPAGLAQLQGGQISAAYTQLDLGLTDNSSLGLQQLSYGQPLWNGRYGAAGVAVQRFDLSGLYDEQTIYLSYGKSVYDSEKRGQLFLGLNAKYLSRSFTPGTACNGFNCAVGSNSVLSGKSSVSAPAADIGVLYRMPWMARRFQTGLDFENVNSPNVGFSGSDIVSPSVHWGLAYKTLWVDANGEVDMNPDPAGGYDQDAIMAAERYFPTLEYGTFALRGSLGYGSRDWEQVTAGLSYRLDKFSVDYGFMMPLAGLQGTSGTHRVALSFLFGSMNLEDQITRGLLEKAAEQLNPTIRAKNAEVAALQESDMRNPHDIRDPKLADVRKLVDAGDYHGAEDALRDYIDKNKPDPSFTRLYKRIRLDASYFPKFDHPTENWEVLLSSGLRRFVYAEDRHSLLDDAYALSLSPENEQLGAYLKAAERGTGIMVLVVGGQNPRGYLGELLYRADIANKRNEYPRAQQFLEDVLFLDPQNVKALERIGSVYYVQGAYEQAYQSWAKALPLEKMPGEREALRTYLPLARSRLGSRAHPSTALPGGVQAASIQPAPGSIAAQILQPKKKRLTSADVRRIESLYNNGVEHYVHGEYLQAEAMFMMILQLDPRNAAAQRALERIKLRTQNQ